MQIRKTFFSLVISVLSSWLTVASGQAAATNTNITSSFSPLASLGQLLFGLVVVVGLIFAATWLMKKMGMQTQTAIGFFKPLAQLAVGQREKIMLVEAADQWLILGVTATQITLLQTLPKGDLQTLTSAPLNTSLPSFTQVLQKFRQSSARTPREPDLPMSKGKS